MLAGVAGFVDVVGYLILHHLFVAHMSGNTARLGVALGHGHIGAAVPYVVAGAAFVGGIALGAVLMEVAPSGRPVVLGAEALLLAALMIYGGLSGNSRGGIAGSSLAPFYVLVVLAIVAMGFQTSALSRVGGQTVRTTYVSGVLTNMTRAAVAAVRARGQEDAERHRRRARLLAAVFACYLVGGVAGSFGHLEARAWSLALPIAVLGACVRGSRV